MPPLRDTEINGQRLGSIIEAVIFAAEQPLSATEIARILTETELAPLIEEQDVETVIDELNAELQDQGRAFEIRLVAGGYTFATQPKYHGWLEHFQHQNTKRKLSASSVETLAIIAYRQPITKPEVDHIRGVDSGYVVRVLLEKQLIEVAGRHDGPGRALLYRTTPIFLQHFGINSVEELPKPREIEEILKDDDMAEHRQLMLELKSDLRPAGAAAIESPETSDADSAPSHSADSSNADADSSEPPETSNAGADSSEPTETSDADTPDAPDTPSPDSPDKQTS